MAGRQLGPADGARAARRAARLRLPRVDRPGGRRQRIPTSRSTSSRRRATVNGDTAVVKLDASGTTGSGTDKGTWQVGGTCASSPYMSPSLGGSSGSKTPTETPTTSSSSAIGIGVGTDRGQSGSAGGGTFYGPSTQLCLAGDLGRRCRSGCSRSFGGGRRPATGSVSVDVVKEDGRWFVSPVSTVLDVVDSAIQHVDERTVYTLLGLAYRLPPDGTITLDQPFTVAGSGGPLTAPCSPSTARRASRSSVRSTGPRTRSRTGRVYAADGHDVGYDRLLPQRVARSYAGTTTLPSTGSYRLVVTGVAVEWRDAHAVRRRGRAEGLGDRRRNIEHERRSPGEACTRTRTSVSVERKRRRRRRTLVPGSAQVVPPTRRHRALPPRPRLPVSRLTTTGVVCIRQRELVGSGNDVRSVTHDATPGRVRRAR